MQDDGVQDDEVTSEAEFNPLVGHWSRFVSWHGEESFWREVYVRMLAALGAAGIVYAVAALAGLVPTTPLAVVGIATVVVTTPFLVYWGGRYGQAPEGPPDEPGLARTGH